MTNLNLRLQHRDILIKVHLHSPVNEKRNKAANRKHREIKRNQSNYQTINTNLVPFSTEYERIDQFHFAPSVSFCLVLRRDRVFFEHRSRRFFWQRDSYLRQNFMIYDIFLSCPLQNKSRAMFSKSQVCNTRGYSKVTYPRSILSISRKVFQR